MAHIIEAQGCDSRKLTVVPNWVDSSFIKPVLKTDNPFLIKHRIENKFVVIYSGNMGSTHDIESLVFVAEELKVHEDIHFLLIGEGIKKEKIGKMILEKSLNNVTLLSLQPSSILPYSLTAGDLAYITLDNGAENASVPSKLYYMLAAGCGIIAVSSENSEIAVLTKFYNFGRVINPGAVESIGNFILECRTDQNLLFTYKDNARKAALNFTPENSKFFYNCIINA
jgi:glycosyltransferase involved in cell wall biosynthesis